MVVLLKCCTEYPSSTSKKIVALSPFDVFAIDLFSKPAAPEKLPKNSKTELVVFYEHEWTLFFITRNKHGQREQEESEKSERKRQSVMPLRPTTTTTTTTTGGVTGTTTTLPKPLNDSNKMTPKGGSPFAVETDTITVAGTSGVPGKTPIFPDADEE